MMEYTMISISVLALCLYYALAIMRLDKKSVLLVSAISVFFQLIMDNYMTFLGLWSFDFSKTLGIAVPIIPLENLLFGIALTVAVVASWERLNRS
jgi:lycopene cyclase domain-containing protein